MNTILIIEDNRELSNELRDTLISEGFYVLKATCGEEAYEIFNHNAIDLCLLDIGLPDISGIELCNKIRCFYKNPIIILTVYDSEDDIVNGLKNGADDYITKPFSIRILLSRISSQLRRREWELIETRKIIYSGDLKIDFDNRIIYKREKEIILRNIEFDICEVLLKKGGRIIKRETLLNTIWDSDNRFIEDNTLSVHMSRLRKKLGTYESEMYIETIKGIGYRWCVDILKM